MHREARLDWMTNQVILVGITRMLAMPFHQPAASIWKNDRPLTTASASTRNANWQAAISSTFVDLAAELTEPEAFSGHLVTREIEGLIVSDIAADAQVVRRGRNEIRRGSTSNLFLIRHSSGICNIDTRNGQNCMSIGDYVLVDPHTPYALGFSEPFRQTCIQLPLGWLRERVPSSLHNSLSVRLAGGSPVTSVLDVVVGQLREMETGQLGADVMRDVFLDVLARAVEGAWRDDSNQRFAPITSTNLVLAHIVQHCSDENLSPIRVANALRCSVRYVHKICASAKTTFGRALMEARLAEAARLLCLLPLGAGRVTEAALQAGFSDLSYFSRTFKERFGVSASVYGC